MSLKAIKEENNKSKKIQLIEENIFSSDKEKRTKLSGRPKKEIGKVCDKKIIIYFTEDEFKRILQKAGSIAMSPFLKNIILDNLK